MTAISILDELRFKRQMQIAAIALEFIQQIEMFAFILCIL